MTSHSDVTGRGYGICGKLSRLRRATFQQIQQPRRRRLDEIKKSVIQTSGARDTRSGKLYLLDTGLLMGGTHVAPMKPIVNVAPMPSVLRAHRHRVRPDKLEIHAIEEIQKPGVITEADEVEPGADPRHQPVVHLVGAL